MLTNWDHVLVQDFDALAELWKTVETSDPELLAAPVAEDLTTQLDLPITIAGPENNHEFFNGHRDLLKYDKLTLKCHNPTDFQTLELYHTHTIFMAPSMLEYGHPNLSLLEAASCGLPIVGTCNNAPAGMILCERDTADVVEKLKIALHNHDRLREMQFEKRDQYDWFWVCLQLKKMYDAAQIAPQNWTSEDTLNAYRNVYV